VPDFAVISLGVNDIGSAVTLATFQTNMEAVIANLVALGVNEIYVTTVWPRNSGGGLTTAPVAAAATTASLTTSNASGTALTFGATVDTTSEILTTSGSPTGTGPYIHTFTTGFVNAHVAGTLVGTTLEALRQSYNNWLRQLPLGCSGMFDLAKLIEWEQDHSKGNPYYMNTYFHPQTPSAYAYIGSEFNCVSSPS
jgi:hypothetical protein